ncbi:hypothetical protein NQ176_g1161 [Zarea fungicola]|uniref:Uncharacterized protein n=1 Tax=Zarea fungicola TaxID=93591 RepID=A0ACC1NVF9_9HYPO|nr:hypothetical protein NQ176_g1161 [Lecanicillium fungicola]
MHTHSAPAHSVQPPVTRASLSELDVANIIHNPELRHAINFDPALLFRPNLDGEKGRRKQDRANKFWHSLKMELSMFMADRDQFHATYGKANDWTLPNLLKAVKEIIQTLVPQSERYLLDEGLDVELLIQQFHKGVADLEKLAQWLSKLLKSHCAPMRDDWVDAMYKQLSSGNNNSDLDGITNGLRSLLNILEAMKLDAANHLIRCLRPALIEDTINFEYKFFLKQIEERNLDISSASQWYKDADARYAINGTQSTLNFGETGVFFEALSHLILPSSPESYLPSTFFLDEERIFKLRSDMIDAINLEICMRMYQDLERTCRHKSSNFCTAPMLDNNALRCYSSPTTRSNFNQSHRTPRPSSLDFCTDDTRTNLWHTSIKQRAYVARMGNESSDCMYILYRSLASLLQSVTPGLRGAARWQSISSLIALHIFRHTKAPESMLAPFEEKLGAIGRSTSSPLYQEVEKSLHTHLMSELNCRVREYRALSGVDLFTSATASRPQSSALGHENESERSNAVIRDIATRLAHLGVLHWRVWSPLLYMNGDYITWQ